MSDFLKTVHIIWKADLCVCVCVLLFNCGKRFCQEHIFADLISAEESKLKYAQPAV